MELPPTPSSLRTPSNGYRASPADRQLTQGPYASRRFTSVRCRVSPQTSTRPPLAGSPGSLLWQGSGPPDRRPCLIGAGFPPSGPHEDFHLLFHAHAGRTVLPRACGAPRDASRLCRGRPTWIGRTLDRVLPRACGAPRDASRLCRGRPTWIGRTLDRVLPRACGAPSPYRNGVPDIRIRGSRPVPGAPDSLQASSASPFFSFARSATSFSCIGRGSSS